MMQDGKEDSMSHVDEGTLHAYLDGELPSTERAAVEAHLAGCAACRGNLTEERSLRDRASAVLGSARPAERPAPPLDQLRREPKRSPWRVRRSVAWAASIALALGVGYYMSPNARAIPAADVANQPVAVAQHLADANDEEKDKSSVRATAPAPPRVYEQRSARPEAERVDSAMASALARTNAAAPALKAADSLRVDARVASGAVAAARRDLPAPAPAAGEPTIVVDGVVAQKLPATNWPVISRRMAKSILGEEPVGLPGLATRRFRRVPGTEGTIVVEQAIDSSTVVQIFQRPAYPYDSTSSASANEGRFRPRGYASEEQARERGNRLFARFVKGLRVEIMGPLSPDSLNRLLEQVAPLPLP
jgi:putative zinc finger protein